MLILSVAMQNQSDFCQGDKRHTCNTCNKQYDVVLPKQKPKQKKPNQNKTLPPVNSFVLDFVYLCGLGC